jgi:hypothetical protein
MGQNDLNLSLLLQETLAMSEYLRLSKNSTLEPESQSSFLTQDNQLAHFDQNEEESFEADTDYLLDLADSMLGEEAPEIKIAEPQVSYDQFPESAGVIYRIDSGPSTFCIRGFSTKNIRSDWEDLQSKASLKRVLLKMSDEIELSEIGFFETANFELAEAAKEQVVNRRFPHQEDAVCNLSDPGFSWWMDIKGPEHLSSQEGRFEIFFRSHGINRAEKYIQLGPIGDGAIAQLRMNQARTLLRSSFPISEFSCDDKSFAVASLKPDHSSFISFKNIFLYGINNTTLENFPDNSLGRTLYFYFHELAVVRKFWIEVKKKLG